MDFTTESQGKSEFNAGISIVMAIRVLKDNSHLARLTNDYPAWASCLESMRSEMEGEVSRHDKDNTECNNFEKEIANQVTIVSMSSQLIISHEVISRLKQSLKDYELFLMRLEKKYGYGMPTGTHAGSVLK